MTLYQDQAVPFSRRVFALFYPQAIIPGLLLLVGLFNLHDANPIVLLWIASMLAIKLFALFRARQWAYRQLTMVAFRDELFEVAFWEKNTMHTRMIRRENIAAGLAWQRRGRIRILRLSLFDGGVKVADFYSGGKQKLEYALEEIVGQINQCKTG